MSLLPLICLLFSVSTGYAGNSPIPSLTQVPSGECCGTASSFISNYGSRGFPNGMNGAGYGVNRGPRTIFTNVVPDHALGYGAGNYGPSSYNRQPFSSNGYPGSPVFGNGFNRPSYGVSGNLNGKPPFDFRDYLRSGFGPLNGGDITWG